MKTCPYCAEEIQSEAIKCRYCHEFMDQSHVASRPPALPVVHPDANPIPWHLRTPVIVILFLTLPPLALPSVWLHPKLHVAWKVGITIATLVICWGCYLAIRAIFLHFSELMRTISTF